MSIPLCKESLASLKVFVELCQKNPGLLHLQDLRFVKEFIESFGGKIPNPGTASGTSTNEPKQSFNTENGSDVEDDDQCKFDMTGVIEPDNDPPQKMGDLEFIPTEEDISKAHSKRSEALSAFAEQNYEKAVSLYTEAIMLNPSAALLYAKRSQAYLSLKKPNACIRDCDRAIELNPDSAAAHKFRGRAHQLLGNWEKAATDLRLACQFDFDEQADEWLREVTPNAKKIEEHKRKKERREHEKAEKEKRERMKKAREEAAKTCENTSDASQADGGNFYQYLSDPEVQAAFQDPEVSAAFIDITSNPTNILKYQKNPKVMNLINKVASKFGGGGGGASFPGMMGGMGGMANAFHTGQR